MPAIPTIDSLVRSVVAEGDPTPLINALVEREQRAADMLRVIAMQSGLYPQFVAWAFAHVGLGTPLSDEELAIIHDQYHALVTQLRNQQEGGGDQPSSN